MWLFSSRRVAVTAVLSALLFTPAMVSMAQSPEATATGEVRRINPEAGKITIKHGSIDVLQLPAMTLVYRINAELLQGVQVGDKVRFTARRYNNEYEVIRIQK